MLSPSLENYMETILLEQEKNRVVRVKNLTDRMKVKTSSVVEALKNLAGRRYVNYEKYSHIELTPKGEKAAREIYQKHKTLRKFLCDILGVKEDLAEADACIIEHYIHQKTLDRLKQFTVFIENYKCRERSLVSEFGRFVRSA